MLEKLIETIVGAAAATPLLAIFAYLWWSERVDRKTLQEKYDELTERVLKALGDATDVSRSVMRSQDAQNLTTEVIKNLLIARLSRGDVLTLRTREEQDREDL